MKYRVVTYGHPVLREKSRRITHITPEIRQLAADLLETMEASNGVGLAAQQVGRTEAICTIDVPATLANGERRPPESDPPVKMPMVLINPKIVKSEGHEVCEEGCLSFPEVFVPIKRAQVVLVRYQDLEGVEHEIRATGLLGRAIQHELDHLNGKLLVDRMAAVRKVALAARLHGLREAGRAQAAEDKAVV